MTTSTFRVLHVHRLPTLALPRATVDILSGLVVPGTRAYGSISGRLVEMLVHSVALECGRSQVDGTFTLQIEWVGAEPTEAVEGSIFEVR